MKRFTQEKKRHSGVSLLVSLTLCVLLLALIFFGSDKLETKTLEMQKTSLQSMLDRGIVECYATEGFYPPSLAYLEEYYAVSYNKERFFVDYQPIGENIMPEVTVILREAAS